MNDFMTVTEVANYLRLFRAQVYNLITRQQIPPVGLGGKRIVVRREQLEKWLQDQAVQAEA
jgi:excisionase family DNA binding protein